MAGFASALFPACTDSAAGLRGVRYTADVNAEAHPDHIEEFADLTGDGPFPAVQAQAAALSYLSRTSMRPSFRRPHRASRHTAERRGQPDRGRPATDRAVDHPHDRHAGQPGDGQPQLAVTGVPRPGHAHRPHVPRLAPHARRRGDLAAGAGTAGGQRPNPSAHQAGGAQPRRAAALREVRAGDD